MATATSLTLRALFSQAAAKATFDRPSPVIAGLTPAAKAFAAAFTARAASGIAVLVVPTDKDVEQITADARFFYGALEGASDADVERAVLPLPSLQVEPSILTGFEQVPVLESQVPAVWHWSLAAHTTAFLPVHTPLWQ